MLIHFIQVGDDILLVGDGYIQCSKLLFLHECLEFLFAQRYQIEGVIRNPFMNIL